MKIKVISTLNMLIFIALFILIVYQLIFSKQPDTGLLYKEAELFAASGFTWIIIKKKERDAYAKLYEAHIDGAFENDKRNYRQLIYAIQLLHQGKEKAAIKLLQRLENSCVERKDTIAVLSFLAPAYARNKEADKAIETYRALLAVNPDKASTWSDLGVLYDRQNHMEMAVDCYKKALACDENYEPAHSNIAFCYLKVKISKVALYHALRALKLKDGEQGTISLVAIAYAQLGDIENMEKYYAMYCDVCSSKREKKELRQILDQHLFYSKQNVKR
ncbi:MAG: tetratricopeptide repeat protein [Lachnospiraceae bacterium]|nr:tetratricopeptide repeat protein [Lachnospiraceae bacterium]